MSAIAVLLLASLAVFGPVGGCYYVQAVSGQMEILRKREPIARILAAPDTPDELAERLSLVREARDFAVSELRLPDNDSYRSFADLGRDFVVWNVFAAPEFSLEPTTWCFPVVGCVAYRGYFSEATARRYADRLAADGLDVFVGGVSAYSTLGRFDDPVLNTMLRWTDADLLATLFHELAHQRLFVKGDTAFNESFATAVADIGLERWVGGHGGDTDLADYLERRRLQKDLVQLVEAAKIELGGIYSSAADADSKRREKARVLAALAERGRLLSAERGRPGANFLLAPLNNARLASIGMYNEYGSAFRHLYDACAQKFDCFYATAESLAGLPPDERSRRLEAAAPGPAAPVTDSPPPGQAPLPQPVRAGSTAAGSSP